MIVQSVTTRRLAKCMDCQRTARIVQSMIEKGSSRVLFLLWRLSELAGQSCCMRGGSEAEYTIIVYGSTTGFLRITPTSTSQHTNSGLDVCRRAHPVEGTKVRCLGISKGFELLIWA